MCWLEITGKLQPAALAPLSGDDVRRLTCLLISPVVGLQQRLVLSPVAGMQQRDAPAGAGITPLKPHQSSPTKPPALATAMDVVSSLSSSPTPAPSVLKSLLLSYAYVSVWITFSISVIMYNKYILDPTMYNWPFPISLTMVHMVFCASLAVVLVRVLRVVAEPTSPPMTPSLYAASVVPIGRALRAVALALMPVVVYCLAIAFRTDSFHHASMLNMLGISAGIAVAAYGEARFDAFGVMLQLVAVTAEATRLVLIQILLTGATPPPAPAPVPAQADRNVEMGLLGGESSASRPAMKPRQVLDCEIAPPSNRATEFGSTGLRVGIDWDAGAIWAF
uniref:Sugar phosphate transporter domain-containing protein n=1 Tax=Oryza sativa subsp. japonica TaxID=39947 RepID=Q8W373_ORYSJ|nr:hypothetical protein [Oryza sativa Japonica Group]